MNYELIRRQNEFDLIFNKTQPIFCDTETAVEEGKTRGGLYGAVRLFQCYQPEISDKALMFDCKFYGLQNVLNLLQNCHLVFHNASYDLHTINCHTSTVWLPKELDDTIYTSRLALFDKGFKFDFYNCLKYIKAFSKELTGIDKAANQKADWAGMMTPQMLQYAAYDVLKLAELYEATKHVKDSESYILDIANLRYAVEYSRRGIPVDRVKIHEKLLEATEEAEVLLQELPVNPRSSKQCCELMGSKSSDEETLVRLELEGNEWAAKIKRARSLQKTIGFLEGYDRKEVKGFYNPSSAVGGRFSCKGGDRYGHFNLQQIPRKLLECLAPPEGKVFVYKDYSGLELRMTVVWTGEPVMEQLMRTGADVHTYTACALFDVGDDLTKHQRNVGKTFTFASLYGAKELMVQMILRTKSKVLMSLSEVKQLMTKYFETYEYFAQWHAMHDKHIKTYGYLDVTTALGRKVRTTKLTDSLAIPIQGSSSEVTKVSLALLKSRYPNENLISTIHDSNTLLVDQDDAELWVERLNDCMVEAWYYVIKNLPLPDLPMPREAQWNTRWDFQ